METLRTDRLLLCPLVNQDLDDLAHLYAQATGAIIGRGGLKPGESPAGITGELSWLLSTDYWGRGLATELGQASIEYGVTKLHLARIFATAYRANFASVRVMQKLGMRQVRADDEEVEYEVELPMTDRLAWATHCPVHEE